MPDKKGKAKSVLGSDRNCGLRNSATCNFGELFFKPRSCPWWMDRYSSWKCILQQQLCTLSWRLPFLFHTSNKPSPLNLYFHSYFIHNYFYHLPRLTWIMMLLLLVRLFWCEIVRSYVPISHLFITYSHFFPHRSSFPKHLSHSLLSSDLSPACLGLFYNMLPRTAHSTTNHVLTTAS